MSDKIKLATQQEMQDKYFDFLLTQALEDAAQIRADDVVRRYENEPEPELSDKFHRKMNSLLHPRKKTKPHLGRAAAIVLLVAGLILGSMTPPAKAFLQQLFGLLLSPQATHTKITTMEEFGQETAQSLKAAGWDYIYYPGYLPFGYTLYDLQIQASLCVITFEKDSKLINIRQQKVANPIKSGVDTEDAYVENMRILGYDALYTQKDDWQNITYHNGECMFIIITTGQSKSELIKIAENLKQIK